MKVKITADSTIDLGKELVAKYDIPLVPFHVLLGDKYLRDGIDVSPKDIYDFVDSNGTLPSTSAPNVDEYAELFSKYSKEYDAVIHISISHKMSSAAQNASIAAKDFANVMTFDSRNMTSSQGYMTIEACEMAARGASAEEIIAKLMDLRDKIETSFVIEKTDYLRKGGRCSALASVGANMLKIRPSIMVKDATLVPGKKYRGNYDACLRQYVSDRLTGRDDIDLKRIMITDSGVPDSTVKMVRECILSIQPFAEILETKAGCTVCSHCGPSTLGILFARK